MIYLERGYDDVHCPECGQEFEVHTYDDQFYDGTYAVQCLDCGTPLKIKVNASIAFTCTVNDGDLV